MLNFRKSQRDCFSPVLARRRDRETAVARDDRGHAVKARRRKRRVPKYLGILVGVNFDEAWGHNCAAGVQYAVT